MDSGDSCGDKFQQHFHDSSTVTKDPSEFVSFSAKTRNFKVTHHLDLSNVFTYALCEQPLKAR